MGESPPLERPALPRTRREVPVDPELSARYVGRYQLGPAAILSVTRDGRHFFAQLTGQPRFEIFEERPKDFFLKVVDAQFTFEVDAGGRDATAVLHQGGERGAAQPRIE